MSVATDKLAGQINRQFSETIDNTLQEYFLVHHNVDLRSKGHTQECVRWLDNLGYRVERFPNWFCLVNDIVGHTVLSVHIDGEVKIKTSYFGH